MKKNKLATKEIRRGRFVGRKSVYQEMGKKEQIIGRKKATHKKQKEKLVNTYNDLIAINVVFVFNLSAN